MSGKKSDHEKEKGVWFTAVSHDLDCREKLKKNCEDYKFWAWVDHSPDKETDEEDKHFHTHLVFRPAGTRSISDVANHLDIPPNFVQKVRNVRSLLRYLRHLDNPEKVQYDEEAVHTNNKTTLQTAWTDNTDYDVRRLFIDMDRLNRGLLTRDEFIGLHYLEFQKMPFYQKIKTYEVMRKICAHLTT